MPAEQNTEAPANTGTEQGQGQTQTQGPGDTGSVAALQNLVNRMGSPDAAAALLYRENHDYRERIRQLTTDLEAVRQQAAQAAQSLQPYVALGDPAQLSGQIERLAALERTETMRQAAAKIGADAEAMAPILRSEQVRVTDAGAFVILADGTEKELKGYIEAIYPKFVPVLFAGSSGSKPAPIGNVQGPKPITQPGTNDEAARAAVRRQVRTMIR